MGGGGLASFEESFAEPVGEVWYCFNFVDDGLDIVFESKELDAIVAEDGIAGFGVEVAWLADAAGVDDGLFAFDECVDTFEVCGWVEVGFVGEDAWDVCVADEAIFFDPLEDLLHFDWRVHGIFGKDIFIDWPTGRAVDVQKITFDDAYAESAEKVPERCRLFFISDSLELAAGPVGGLFGCEVEVRRFIEHSEVMVADECPVAFFCDEIDTFDGIGTVANDIAEADDAINVA